jgi:chemotaxis protein MotB
MPVKKFLKAVHRLEEQEIVRKGEPEKHEYHPPHQDESNWLVSYADMMTLLCGFFIMLFSMASLDQPKFEKVKESVAHQFGGKYTSPTEDLGKFVSQVIEQAGISKDTVIKTDATSVSVVFQSTIFFDTLSSEVKPQGQIVLTRLIQSIATRQLLDHKEYKIVVEGHTDSRPIVGGLFPSNWELSGARAARVVRMFLERGFKADHLIAIGYGDTRPQFEARSPAGILNEEALGKNRRVVLRIMEPGVDSIPLPEKASPASSAH